MSHSPFILELYAQTGQMECSAMRNAVSLWEGYTIIFIISLFQTCKSRKVGEKLTQEPKNPSPTATGVVGVRDLPWAALQTVTLRGGGVADIEASACGLGHAVKRCWDVEEDGRSAASQRTVN